MNTIAKRLQNVKKFIPFSFNPLLQRANPFAPRNPRAKKILVVDDDYMSLAMVNLYLTNKHYTVLPANGSLEAIKLLQNFKPDLLILDIFMPYMTGLEFLSYLRYEFLIKDIPVIITSFMNDEEVKETAEKLGVNRYITKPFDMEDLVALIQKLPGF